MGVIEYFGTLIKNQITSSSIKSDFKGKINVNHFLIDFNSIVHVSSQKLVSEINSLLKEVLTCVFQKRNPHNDFLTEQYQKFKFDSTNITQNSEPKEIVKMFREHFSEKSMDKLVITHVIQTVISLIHSHCNMDKLETIMFAIDGVPSKAKIIEQKQRRYMGAIVEKYKKRIFKEYVEEIKTYDNFAYYSTKYDIKWNKNKITPGTIFMHKMVKYLHSEKIQAKIRKDNNKLKFVISDMYEIGEGEKKIVNYVKHKLADTNDTIIFYSPDADVILLCIILPLKNVFMLRHNQQTSAQLKKNVYDLIDIHLLKTNINEYFTKKCDKKYDYNSINYDIVCLSTLFGNDFVPKIETINVKSGFQNIIHSYIKALNKYPDEYLMSKENKIYKLNHKFLSEIFKNLVKWEDDFIQYNSVYNTYINAGMIKQVFDYIKITSENIVQVYSQFMGNYGQLKEALKMKRNYSLFLKDDKFIMSLKRCINILADGKSINAEYLTDEELINAIIRHNEDNNSYPHVSINLQQWSHSIQDQRHMRNVKEKKMNEYQKETYKFENMLDEYYVKFNADKLDLSEHGIEKFYDKYFEIKNPHEKLNKDACNIMKHYVQGLLWVFNYYFNDDTYANTWYYMYERSPLLKHISMYLNDINETEFNKINKSIDNYKVSDDDIYFNPVEQLIYVSPLTDDVVEMIPKNFRELVLSEKFKKFTIDIDDLVEKIWNEKVSDEIDCSSIPYFNKCFIKSVAKNNTEFDVKMIKLLRTIEHSKTSIELSKSANPTF
jgi:5'-3' exonuclease